MSKRDWRILFEDMLEATDKIERYTAGMEYDDFVHTSLVIDAVVRNVEIIGEASKQVPAQVQGKYTRIPWRQLAGIRNRIVHEYFGVDVGIIWHIVTNELPKLKSELRKALSAD